MLRQFTPDFPGYWLITHPDHARLAGQFAEAWGNDLFLTPEPRFDVLEAIHHHDDGWLLRDSCPEITRQGKPSAFSSELVGKYSAFEEIDLDAYLAVRQRALEEISTRNPYAAIIISKHTYNLLSARADRSTIADKDQPLLDTFLDNQYRQQKELRDSLMLDGSYPSEAITWEKLEQHFRLLQACDNLSLLSCVDYYGTASLLHPLPTKNGNEEVAVRGLGQRRFTLDPWPFASSTLSFSIIARRVPGETFSTHEELRDAFHLALPTQLTIELSPA